MVPAHISVLEGVYWKWTLSKDQLYYNKKSNRKYIYWKSIFNEILVVSHIWYTSYGKQQESTLKHGKLPLSITSFGSSN